MRTTGLAAAVAIAVTAIGLILQTGELPAAAAGQVAAVHAVRWLDRYRYAASTLDVNGRLVRGRCFHGWFGAGTSGSLHGTELKLGNGSTFVAVKQHIVGGGANLLPGLNALELAGCPKVLGARLASLVVAAPAITVVPTWFDGTRALALHAERLTVLLAPRSDRPVGVELRGVTSRIRLLPVTRRRLEPFDPRV